MTNIFYLIITANYLYKQLIAEIVLHLLQTVFSTHTLIQVNLLPLARHMASSFLPKIFSICLEFHGVEYRETTSVEFN